MIRKMLKLRVIAVFVLCTVLLFLLISAYNIITEIYYTKYREELLTEIRNLIKSHQGGFPTEGQACRIPDLRINSSEILSLLKKPEPIICDKNKDWIEVKGSVAEVADWVTLVHGNVECSFTEILRKSDFKHQEGQTATMRKRIIMRRSDVYNVHCESEQGKSWNKVITGIRTDHNILDRTNWNKVPEDSLKLNVIMLGIDSMSHNMWKRKLSKTYNYATNDLKGIALNGYNIVGDGTPQALIPILTGKTELELPDTRKRKWTKARYVNVYPFIWNDFKKYGYVTAWSEDLIKVGTFTYRLKGFLEQPVDHYMRNFYVAASENFSKKNYCYGGVSRFQIQLDFVRNMYEVYSDKPKFVFVFHREYSHDYNNLIENADNEIYEWLKDFKEKGHLNNTLVILMSDHGSRFPEFRNTLQGKLEERLPGFIFVFPPWFEKKFPNEMMNFRNNVNKLTTPFDIYETLKNVLHFERPGKVTFLQRGISLFKEIPLSRTCKDASIEPHWCTCLNWEDIEPSESNVQFAVEHFIEFLNNLTSKHRDLCAELMLKGVLWSAKLIPNKNLLKFKKSSDYDGFVGDMSDNTQISMEIYQVKVFLNPGDMIFKASIKYYTKENKFSVSESDVKRINQDAGMNRCINDFHIPRRLRKYCYCLKG